MACLIFRAIVPHIARVAVSSGFFGVTKMDLSSIFTSTNPAFAVSVLTDNSPFGPLTTTAAAVFATYAVWNFNNIFSRS
jgi:hypothetical protein